MTTYRCECGWTGVPKLENQFGDLKCPACGRYKVRRRPIAPAPEAKLKPCEREFLHWFGCCRKWPDGIGNVPPGVMGDLCRMAFEGGHVAFESRLREFLEAEVARLGQMKLTTYGEGHRDALQSVARHMLGEEV